jgi:hypothetical protein
VQPSALSLWLALRITISVLAEEQPPPSDRARPLDFINGQLARVPTRMELARIAPPQRRRRWRLPPRCGCTRAAAITRRALFDTVVHGGTARRPDPSFGRGLLRAADALAKATIDDLTMTLRDDASFAFLHLLSSIFGITQDEPVDLYASELTQPALHSRAAPTRCPTRKSRWTTTHAIRRQLGARVVAAEPDLEQAWLPEVPGGENTPGMAARIADGIAPDVSQGCWTAACVANRRPVGPRLSTHECCAAAFRNQAVAAAAARPPP